MILLAVLPFGHALAQTCVVPTTDLVSWWPGEGDAMDIVDSNHGNPVNVTFAPGVVGQAFKLGGEVAYVNFGEGLSLNPMLSGDFSISGWVKIPPPNNVFGHIIIDRGDDFAAQQNRFFRVDVFNNKLRGWIRGDSGESNTVQVFSNTTLPTGSIVHFSFIRIKGVRGELYINGILDTSNNVDDAGDVTFSASRPLTLGAGNLDAIGGPNGFFVGLIDEVMIHNRALSSTEVENLFACGDVMTSPEALIQQAYDIITALPLAAVTTGGNQKALTNFLSQAIVAIQNNHLATARHKVEEAIERTDGCVLRGAPDGSGPGRDWITSCAAQMEIYDLLTAALAALPM